MPNVFISMPVMDKPELACLQSLYSTILSCKEHSCRLYFTTNDSLISRVRNVNLSTFYYNYPECEYFISIDSDLEIMNCHSSNNLIKKLISHNLDFVGGLYSIKKQGEPRCSSITNDSKEAKFNSGLIEMRWLSTGCWCIKRSAIKKMIEAYPDLDYDGDDTATGLKCHALYQPIIYQIEGKDFPINPNNIRRKYLSEDWSYCYRWKKIGGKIFADTSIVLKHIGKADYSLFNVEMKKG